MGPPPALQGEAQLPLQREPSKQGSCFGFFYAVKKNKCGGSQSPVHF